MTTIAAHDATLEALFRRALETGDGLLLAHWALARWPTDDWPELRAALEEAAR